LTEQVVNHTRGAQHPQFGKINNPLLDKGDFVFALAGGSGPRPTPSPGKTQPKARDERPDPVTGMVFVWVPEGRFTMGSPVREAGRDSDEGQVDSVTMNGFWMGKHEVTRGQFRKFVEATGYVTDAEKAGWSWYWNTDEKKWDRKNGLAWQRAGFEQGDDHPVVHVSWNDANAMVEWMNRTGTDTVRLPTEAQWEYACRGGTRTARFWGDGTKAACEFANMADQTSARQFNWEPIHPCTDGFVYTAPVGSFRPNPFGLHDMLGNVWEWCADAYSATANIRSAAQNSPGSGAESDRVGRGGGWNGHPDSVRSANRNHDDFSLESRGGSQLADHPGSCFAGSIDDCGLW
jgi:formylglycine-generating enzyme required for sulfatase activity